MLLRNEIKSTTYKVVSHSAVAEFLGKEPEARELIRQFAAGESFVDRFTIAGPPSMKELARLRVEPDQNFMLPTITINMRRERENLTLEPLIRLMVSDSDLAELARWQAVLRAGQLSARTLAFGAPDVH